MHRITETRTARGPGAIATGLILALGGALATAPAMAMDPDDPDYDPLEDDSLWEDGPPGPGQVDPEDAQTTSPELRIYAEPPEERDTPLHHHDNHLTLDEDSLNDGWVRLRQCHSGLAEIGRMSIVYNEPNIRGLRVASADEVEDAWAEDDRVVVIGVTEASELCVEAEMRVVESRGNGEYVLENGPFMRRFLDGYFPMRVTLTLSWGDLDLSLEDTIPERQPGVDVRGFEHGMILDTTFEGELETRIRLSRDE